MTFEEARDYEWSDQGDDIEIEAEDRRNTVGLISRTKNKRISLVILFNERERDLVKHGGALPPIMNTKRISKDQGSRSISSGI